MKTKPLPIWVTLLHVVLLTYAVACATPQPSTPRPPSPTTQTFALTVVVTDARTGGPLAATVATDGLVPAWKVTANKAGFARREGFTGAGQVCAALDAYEVACQAVDDNRSHVVVLSLKRSIQTPTAESRMRFGASFATHNVADVPAFDPFWSGLTSEQRQRWLADKRARKLTHILLARTWGYPRYTDRTGYQGGTLSHQEFNARISEAFAGGLWPLVWLPFDDDAAGQAAVYDGRMEIDLRALLPVLDQVACVSPMWEAPGAWTAKAIADAGALARRILGPSACLILHGRDNERFTGASYKGIIETTDVVPAGLSGRRFFDAEQGRDRIYLTEADDPSGGDEIGWWFVPGADQYDVFAWESRHGRDGPTYSNGIPDANSGTWLGRFLEGWERFAPSGTFMPLLNRPVRSLGAPDWFARVRARGRPILSPFELQEYEDVLDVVPDSRIDDVADLLEGLGVQAYGSGIPRSWQR